MLPSLGINSWNKKTISDLTSEILSISPKPLVLIDGKGGSGKTSFAVKLTDALRGSIISTDDVAWWADPIYWDGELIAGIIQPWLDGKNVKYTPSGWVKKNRAGFLEADSRKALVIEGSGACRKTLRKFSTYSIWIETEPSVARERVIKRDLANGENGVTLESVTKFTDEWDSLVDPFLLEESVWYHTNIIISGEHSDLEQDVLKTHPPLN